MPISLSRATLPLVVAFAGGWALAQPAAESNKPTTPADGVKPTPPALPAEPTRQPSAPGTSYAGAASMLTNGFSFTEGPLYIGSGRLAGYWVFSDIPKSNIHAVRFGAGIDKASSDGKPIAPIAIGLLPKTLRANGLALSADGRLIAAESDGSIGVWGPIALPEAKSSIVPMRSTLVETFDTKRFNSPNDLCIGAAGDIYFTDPAYFAPQPRPQPCEGVYHIPGVKTGDTSGTAHSSDAKATLISDQYKRPNGICLSPDGKTLYVGDAGTREIYFHAVSDDGSVAKNRTKLADVKGVKAAGRGGVDGLKCDSAGRVHVTGPGGIWCFSAKGEWLDRVELPYASNFAFGGADGKDILVTSGQEIWRARLK